MAFCQQLVQTPKAAATSAYRQLFRGRILEKFGKVDADLEEFCNIVTRSHIKSIVL